MPILSSLDHVRRQLSRTEKEIRTFTRKCSSSLQNVRTIHLQYYTSDRRSSENIRHEKELRLIKNRGYFPAPQLAPKECKIETIQDKEALIKEINEVAVEMLNAIRESEENYRKEQEQARIRAEQLRSTRQTSRSDINLYPTLANSTPIRNTNTRSDQPGVHFNTNTVQHVYATTWDRGEQFEPPENDSILQGATSPPADQVATSATDTAGCNELWRQNNTTNIGPNTFSHRTTTRPTSRNEPQTNNPSNPVDPRSGPTCFRCGEQGHMRLKCRKKSILQPLQKLQPQHKSMQKASKQYTEPDPQPNSDRLPPNSVTTTINGSSGSHTTHRCAQQSVVQRTRQ